MDSKKSLGCAICPECGIKVGISYKGKAYTHHLPLNAELGYLPTCKMSGEKLEPTEPRGVRPGDKYKYPKQPECYLDSEYKQCCCNCKLQVKICCHPCNKKAAYRGPISNHFGFGCTLFLEMEHHGKETRETGIIFYEKKHSIGCECYSKKTDTDSST